MSKYTLDEALQKVFNDREYYLSLSKGQRSLVRSYRGRYEENKLSIVAKMALIKKYDTNAKVSIVVEF